MTETGDLREEVRELKKMLQELGDRVQEHHAKTWDKLEDIDRKLGDVYART